MLYLLETCKTCSCIIYKKCYHYLLCCAITFFIYAIAPPIIGLSQCSSTQAQCQSQHLCLPTYTFFFQCPFFLSLVILLLVCLYNLQFEIMTSHLNVIYIFQTSFLEADFHLFVSGGVACCIDVMSLQAKPLYMYSPPTLSFTPC